MVTRLKWLGATLLLVATMVLAALGYDEGSTAEAIGAGFGIIVVPLALAAAARFLYLRFNRTAAKRPFWTPAVVAGAATVALIAGIAVGIEDEQDFGASVDSCKASEPSPLSDAPAGLRFAALTAAQEANLAAVAQDLPSEVALQELITRQVVERGQTIAVALAYPGVGSDENFRDFQAGFVDGARESGGTTEELEIGGSPAVVATLPQQGSTVAGRSGCNGILVASADEATAIRVARALLER